MEYKEEQIDIESEELDAEEPEEGPEPTIYRKIKK